MLWQKLLFLLADACAATYLYGKTTTMITYFTKYERRAPTTLMRNRQNCSLLHRFFRDGALQTVKIN